MLFHRKWVLGAVDFEMEVAASRAVGPAGIADQGDFLTLKNIVAFGNQVLQGMGISGLCLVGVFD